ncbi:hypothetical protein GCM10010123_20260 [Pilimelia anulata]|uniref:Uncharacterized protein n=1 Tax=Pilimelia anulata TaxID=53371 RepID=A0A8J3FC74_9ACTN|nr:hypothetical protein GCM10010123_20260 [Pilimelia anulata]
MTGVSGSGKSTLATHLQRAGHDAVSLDGDPALCTWADHTGQPVTRPPLPDARWLAEHRWIWNADRLRQLVNATAPDGVRVRWLCGRADNALDLADLFDLIVVLHIDEPTMRKRLLARAGGNDYGRSEDTLGHALAQHAAFTSAWRRRGAAVMDATAPLEVVAAQLLRMTW